MCYSSQHLESSLRAPVDSTAGLIDFVSQEKQEEGVKNQFVTSIADAKARMKKSWEVLGQDQAEVSHMIRHDTRGGS